MVGLGRFELPTSRLSSARSNQLSYRPCGQKPGIRSQRRRLEDQIPTARLVAHNSDVRLRLLRLDFWVGRDTETAAQHYLSVGLIVQVAKR